MAYIAQVSRPETITEFCNLHIELCGCEKKRKVESIPHEVSEHEICGYHLVAWLVDRRN